MTPEELLQSPQYQELNSKVQADTAALEASVDALAQYGKTNDVAIHAELSVDVHVHKEPLSSLGPTVKHRYTAGMI